MEMPKVGEGLNLNKIWNDAQGAYTKGSGLYGKRMGFLDEAARSGRPLTPRLEASIARMPVNQVRKFMGSKMGPTVAAVGLGVGALGQLGNMRQRLRYHDYGGAALSGGMAAGMAAGAFMIQFEKKAMGEHLERAAMSAGRGRAGFGAAARSVIKAISR